MDLKARILSVLADHRVMAVATVRPDGWPQATMVGYVHDDLSIYFVVARDSQKLANIERDPRVSIAVGGGAAGHVRGLSMAARVSEVTDPQEVALLNRLVAQRYPEQAVFAPRRAVAAVLCAAPEVISLIDESSRSGAPDLVEVMREAVLRPLDSGPER